MEPCSALSPSSSSTSSFFFFFFFVGIEWKERILNVISRKLRDDHCSMHTISEIFVKSWNIFRSHAVTWNHRKYSQLGPAIVYLYPSGLRLNSRDRSHGVFLMPCWLAFCCACMFVHKLFGSDAGIFPNKFQNALFQEVTWTNCVIENHDVSLVKKKNQKARKLVTVPLKRIRVMWHSNENISPFAASLLRLANPEWN